MTEISGVPAYNPQYEEAPDLPAIQPKRRANRAPFIVAGGLLLVLAAAFFAINASTKPKIIPAMPLEEGWPGTVRNPRKSDVTL